MASAASASPGTEDSQTVALKLALVQVSSTLPADKHRDDVELDFFTNATPAEAQTTLSQVGAPGQYVIVPGQSRTELVIVWKWHDNDYSTYVINEAQTFGTTHYRIDQIQFLRLSDVLRVFIGGMQRYLHLLLKDEHCTTETPQELVKKMHYDHELKGEWIPAYLRHSSAGGEFEALFSVYNQRHDSLGWTGMAKFKVTHTGYHFADGQAVSTIPALLSHVRYYRSRFRMPNKQQQAPHN